MITTSTVENIPMADDSPIKISKFNEAGLQMTRLHELQRCMNEFRVNPFVKSHSDIQYDFELWMACVEGLYLEISSKLNTKENDACMDLINETRHYMQELLLIQDHTLWNLKIHRKTMWKIRLSLFDTEKHVRRLLEHHGLGTPNVEEDAGFD